MLGKYEETLVVDWGLCQNRSSVTSRPRARAKTCAHARLEPQDNGPDTPTVGVVGTVAYMSPEQAEGAVGPGGPGERPV